MSKVKQVKFLMWDERSIRTKKNRNKGSQVNQLERLYFVIPDDMSLVFKKRKHYSGTSHGDCIGPILAPAWDEPWMQKSSLANISLIQIQYPFLCKKIINLLCQLTWGWRWDLATLLRSKERLVRVIQPDCCWWEARNGSRRESEGCLSLKLGIRTVRLSTVLCTQSTYPIHQLARIELRYPAKRRRRWTCGISCPSRWGSPLSACWFCRISKIGFQNSVMTSRVDSSKNNDKFGFLLII